MRSTGLVLAAGGVALANEALFAPAASLVSPAAAANNPIVSETIGTGTNNPIVAAEAGVAGLAINWRIIPATLVLALLLGGLEEIAPTFAVGLAGMTLVAVLIVQVGNAPTPLENVATTLGVST